MENNFIINIHYTVDFFNYSMKSDNKFFSLPIKFSPSFLLTYNSLFNVIKNDIINNIKNNKFYNNKKHKLIYFNKIIIYIDYNDYNCKKICYKFKRYIFNIDVTEPFELNQLL